MFRIDVSDPSTHGILGDDHYEMNDDGNERLLMDDEEAGEQVDDVERCNPPELTDVAEKVGEQTDAAEEETGEEEQAHEIQDVDEIGEHLQALQVQESQVKDGIGWGRVHRGTIPFNENEPTVHEDVDQDNISYTSYDEDQAFNEEDEDNVLYGEEDSGVYGADNPDYQEQMAEDLSDIHPPTETERLGDMVRMAHYMGIHVHRAITNTSGYGANRTIPPPFDVARHPDSALLDSGTACSIIGNHWTEDRVSSTRYQGKRSRNCWNMHG